MAGSRTGSTPVSHGVALPHLRLAEVDRPELVLVRTRAPLAIPIDTTGDAHPNADARVHALFVLLSPLNPPGRHLRTLAALARRIDDDPFLDDWLRAETEQGLKEVLIHNDRFLALTLDRDGPLSELIGRPLRDVPLPRGVLVALVHRGDEIAVPGGGTVLEAGDRLTVIGDAAGVKAVSEQFGA